MTTGPDQPGMFINRACRCCLDRCAGCLCCAVIYHYHHAPWYPKKGHLGLWYQKGKWGHLSLYKVIYISYVTFRNFDTKWPLIEVTLKNLVYKYYICIIMLYIVNIIVNIIIIWSYRHILLSYVNVEDSKNSELHTLRSLRLPTAEPAKAQS